MFCIDRLRRRYQSTPGPVRILPRCGWEENRPVLCLHPLQPPQWFEVSALLGPVTKLHHCFYFVRHFRDARLEVLTSYHRVCSIKESDQESTSHSAAISKPPSATTTQITSKLMQPKNRNPALHGCWFRSESAGCSANVSMGALKYSADQPRLKLANLVRNLHALNFQSLACHPILATRQR